MIYMYILVLTFQLAGLPNTVRMVCLVPDGCHLASGSLGPDRHIFLLLQRPRVQAWWILHLHLRRDDISTPLELVTFWLADQDRVRQCGTPRVHGQLALDSRTYFQTHGQNDTSKTLQGKKRLISVPTGLKLLHKIWLKIITTWINFCRSRFRRSRSFCIQPTSKSPF